MFSSWSCRKKTLYSWNKHSCSQRTSCPQWHSCSLRTPRSKAPLPICMLITLIWDEKKERKTHMCVFTPRVRVSQFTVRVTSCLYFEGSTFDVTTHSRRCSVGVAPPFLSVFLFFQVSRFSSQSAHSWTLSLRRKISPVCNR